jgi:hypothetical protein
MISQIAAKTVKVVAEGLAVNGETEARPRPEPKARSMIVAAVAMKAPAKIAGQDTAESGASGAAVLPR